MDRNVVFQVASAVAVPNPAEVFYQDRSSSGDAIHNTLKNGPFEWKGDTRASSNVEFFGSSLLLRNQLVAMLGVPKHVASDRLKSTG